MNGPPDDSGPLPAGDFGPWLVEIQGAIRGDHPSQVPCGTCTACCSSSQFVHIGPDETDTLAHVPSEVLFPAPGLPEGHVLMGYDEHGRCPMLVDELCTVYDHRPRTCRTYDCRVFPATGLVPEESKVLITRRVRRWVFSDPGGAAAAERDAVEAAARALGDLRDEGAGVPIPRNPTQLAALAIELHHEFLSEDPSTGEQRVVVPSTEVVRAALARLSG